MFLSINIFVLQWPQNILGFICQIYKLKTLTFRISLQEGIHPKNRLFDNLENNRSWGSSTLHCLPSQLQIGPQFIFPFAHLHLNVDVHLPLEAFKTSRIFRRLFWSRSDDYKVQIYTAAGSFGGSPCLLLTAFRSFQAFLHSLYASKYILHLVLS